MSSNSSLLLDPQMDGTFFFQTSQAIQKPQQQQRSIFDDNSTPIFSQSSLKIKQGQGPLINTSIITNIFEPKIQSPQNKQVNTQYMPLQRIYSFQCSQQSNQDNTLQLSPIPDQVEDVTSTEKKETQIFDTQFKPEVKPTSFGDLINKVTLLPVLDSQQNQTSSFLLRISQLRNMIQSLNDSQVKQIQIQQESHFTQEKLQEFLEYEFKVNVLDLENTKIYFIIIQNNLDQLQQMVKLNYEEQTKNIRKKINQLQNRIDELKKLKDQNIILFFRESNQISKMIPFQTGVQFKIFTKGNNIQDMDRTVLMDKFQQILDFYKDRGLYKIQNIKLQQEQIQNQLISKRTISYKKFCDMGQDFNFDESQTTILQRLRKSKASNSKINEKRFIIESGTIASKESLHKNQRAFTDLEQNYVSKYDPEELLDYQFRQIQLVNQKAEQIRIDQKEKYRQEQNQYYKNQFNDSYKNIEVKQTSSQNQYPQFICQNEIIDNYSIAQGLMYQIMSRIQNRDTQTQLQYPVNNTLQSFSQISPNIQYFTNTYPTNTQLSSYQTNITQQPQINYLATNKHITSNTNINGQKVIQPQMIASQTNSSLISVSTQSSIQTQQTNQIFKDSKKYNTRSSQLR